MKLTHLIVLVVAGAIAANAQTPAKHAASAATKAKPASSATKLNSAATDEAKLPPGVPPVAGVKKIAFSLRYQDIVIGTGPDAVSNKLYKVNYTGWLASDGKKFDSSFDHRSPVTDADGKPVLDADGKPKLGDPQPIAFPQGFGRVIPGWDQGFNGMKIGGKRRLFIPWQLAYGAIGRPGPDPAHPIIPSKADLIFDVELVEISDMPMPQNHPPNPSTGAAAPAQAQPHPPASASPNGTAPQPGTAAPPPVQSTPEQANPPAPAAPATPPPAPATPPPAPQQK